MESWIPTHRPTRLASTTGRHEAVALTFLLVLFALVVGTGSPLSPIASFAAGESIPGYSIGAGSDTPVALTGLWEFDARSQDFDDGVSCPFDVPFVFGDSLTAQDWVPSPESVLPARVEWWDPAVLDLEEFPTSVESPDVGGGVVAFDLPEGYPPQSIGWLESPVIDFVELGGQPNPMDFHFSSNSPADPEVELLTWLVGIRVFDGIEWSPWEDVTVQVLSGPASYVVPLPMEGSVCQVRLGIHNPTDVLIKSRTKADKAKGKTKEPSVIAETWKYVPDIKQDGPTCAAASSANCLSYWAQSDYPEIYPTDEDDSISKKHRELRKALEKEIYGEDGEVGGVGEDADNYGGGIGSHLKKRGVDQPLEDGRSGLEQIHIDTLAANWDTLTHHFGLCHDVLLNFGWYDSDGNLVKRDGRPVTHQVTMAGLVKTNDGKYVIHVANPWGSDTDEVGPDNRDETYDEMEVEVTADGKVKLRNEDIQKKVKRGGYLCLREIQVVRPRPAESLVPPLFATEVGARRRGGDASYGYGVVNNQSVEIDIVVMNVKVPVSNVQAPSGWTWNLLPETLPGSSCSSRYGETGIVWRTFSNPVPPEGTLSGFSFEADAEYPVESRGIQFYEGMEGFAGRYGFVGGPVPQLSTDVDIDIDPESSRGFDTLLSFSRSPSPASGPIDIQFALRKDAAVRLDVFDTSGRLVRRLREEWMTSGEHRLQWNRVDRWGSNVPSGVYFLRLQSGDQSMQMELVLVN